MNWYITFLWTLIITGIHVEIAAFIVSFDRVGSTRRHITHSPFVEERSQSIDEPDNSFSASQGYHETVDADSIISSDQLASELQRLCSDSKLVLALEVLEEAEKGSETSDSKSFPNEQCYTILLQELAKTPSQDHPELADALFERMITLAKKKEDALPSKQAVNAIVSVWEASSRKEAGSRCRYYLDTLWSLYKETGNRKYIPLRGSYISTISALSRSRQGRKSAEMAEELLEEMESLRHEYPHLTPNTLCVNGVLNAWSKSGVWYGAATRSEEILEKMIRSYEMGRVELQPDTTSFNTVIDTLAKSREANNVQRAEVLLEKMEILSSKDEALRQSCAPDQVSFNIVLNCWAQSRQRGAAHRATDILKHMEHRYFANYSDIHPDTTSYTTVINAWSRSRDRDALDRAEEVFGWSENAFLNGNTDARPNTLTYNSLINCYSKSNRPDASERVLELLNTMRQKCTQKEFEDCHPDVITYTSIIDTLAKQGTLETSKKAEALLEELESSFSKTGDPRLTPNIRTYTSVINAIARSRSNPERAEALLNRIESLQKAGFKDVKPDVVSYNALINAYGWSNQRGKAAKCYNILKRMLELYETSQNIEAKPDIITCNSVLNACAFEPADSESERAEVLDIVVQTLEIFQSQAPQFGYPDHNTYSQVLLALSRHMPKNDRRFEMAEATFWQCCKSGNVSAMVIGSLQIALSWCRFSVLLGPALLSKEGEKPRYDLSKLPREWTRHSPQALARNKKKESRPSKKRDKGFQVTKSSLSKGKQTLSRKAREFGR